MHQSSELHIIVLALNLLLQPVDAFFIYLRRRQSCLLGKQKLSTFVDQVAPLLFGLPLVSQVVIERVIPHFAHQVLAPRLGFFHFLFVALVDRTQQEVSVLLRIRQQVLAQNHQFLQQSQRLSPHFLVLRTCQLN